MPSDVHRAYILCQAIYFLLRDIFVRIIQLNTIN